MSEINATIDLEEDFPQGEINIEVTADKPFNKCFSCEFFRNGCSGPNLKATSIERECEFMQLCRVQLGYSYQKTADLSGLAIATVKRILKGQIKDPAVSTMRALNNVLVSDPKIKSPCAIDLVAQRAEEAQAECRRLQELLNHASDEHRAGDLEKITFLTDQVEYLKSRVAFLEAQVQEKDLLIHDDYAFFRRKNRIIALLITLLLIAIAAIIGFLAADKINPNIGFFWAN